MSTFTICETYNLIPDYVNNKVITIAHTCFLARAGIDVLTVSNKKNEGDVRVLVRSLRSPRTTLCKYGWVIRDVCI